jgi:ABC-type uncharacterized transport system permease subunit
MFDQTTTLLILLCYAALCISGFYRLKSNKGAIPSWNIALLAFLHILVISWQSYSLTGKTTFQLLSPSGVFHLITLLITLSLSISLKKGHSAFLIPFSLLPALLTLLAALITPTYFTASAPIDFWFQLHLLGSILALTCFSIAAILSLLHFILEFKLKSRSFDSLFHKLPSLPKIDLIHKWWIQIALGSTLFAMGSISIWIKNSPNPSILSSLLTFLPFVTFFVLQAFKSKFVPLNFHRLYMSNYLIIVVFLLFKSF